jgi:thiamine kinase-like enzyme
VQTAQGKVAPYLLQRLSHLQLLDPAQPVLFTRLRGGMTNKVYLLEQGGTRLTVKMYEENTKIKNPLYSNLPTVEARTLDYLAGSDMTPCVLDSWLEKPIGGKGSTAILVYEYLEGEVWQSDTAAVAELLSILHNPTVTPPPSWLRQLPLSAHEVCLHADKILQHVSSFDAESLQQLRPNSPNKLPVVSKSFIHGDCWAGNFVQSNKSLKLIDWQCPGMGDAVEDISNFLSPGMMSFCRDKPLSDEERQAFFQAYSNEAVIERYHRDAVSWHWRLACYYLYRRESLKAVQPELAMGYGRALVREMEFIQTSL